MDNTVALAAIGLAGTSIAGVIWLAKYLARTLSADLKEHTKAAITQSESNKEMLRFMRNLNGKLEKAYKDKLNGK